MGSAQWCLLASLLLQRSRAPLVKPSLQICVHVPGCGHMGTHTHTLIICFNKFNSPYTILPPNHKENEFLECIS